jgi:phosphoserine phosphatase
VASPADAPPPYSTVIFDCDSTLSAIEGIDELAALSGLRAESSRLTDRAMTGEISLESVYSARLELIQPTRAALDAVGRMYVARVLPHSRELIRALRALEKRVCIVSGGLEPAVLALAAHIGIAGKDVRAVAIHHEELGRYIGFDTSSPLARSGGKVAVTRALAEAPGGRPAVLIGDGITDLEAAGECARFIAFGGVVRRDAVFERATVTCESGDLAALVPLLLSQEEIDILSMSREHGALLAAART